MCKSSMKTVIHMDGTPIAPLLCCETTCMKLQQVVFIRSKYGYWTITTSLKVVFNFPEDESLFYSLQY